MSAIMSSCRKYRYQLHRNVDIFGLKTFAFFGVNPSMADEFKDDRTVKRLIGFALRNEGKDFFVGNVCGYRDSDVTQLSSIEDPIGIDNDHHIDDIISKSDILVPCWGSRDKLPEQLHPRLDSILKKLHGSSKPVLSFGTTASGDPRHPLFLSYDTPLAQFNKPSTISGSK